MVPCGLILSSASSSFPKGSILKLSKKTCEALDLAKGALKMTPNQQISSKHTLKMLEIVTSVEHVPIQQSSPGHFLEPQSRK